MVKFPLVHSLAFAFVSDRALQTGSSLLRTGPFCLPNLQKKTIGTVTKLSESHAATGHEQTIFSQNLIKEEIKAFDLEELCTCLGAKPQGLLRLETKNGVRGVYINRPIRDGEAILQVPLDACLLDDRPPEWWMKAKKELHDEGEDVATFSYKNPSEWASRLTASLLDLQMKRGNLASGHELWLSSLPDPTFLRASLPVHWPEEILRSARCTALELAVDSAYFARADAVTDLVFGLQKHSHLTGSISSEDLREICHDALDLVQTRACRVEGMENEPGVSVGTPLRVLAPVFDMINHGSSKSRRVGHANGHFGVELLHEDSGKSQLCLSVRALGDLEADSEVLIDYGQSTRPPWKCLFSYGFVPQQSIEDIYDDGDDDEIVAEVFMDGTRYEVSPSTIPVEMVAAATSLGTESSLSNGGLSDDGSADEAELDLTSEIALMLAGRISLVSSYLLLDDKEGSASDSANAYDEGKIDKAEELISLQLASSLRFSHHRILRVCAEGLEAYANQ